MVHCPFFSGIYFSLAQGCRSNARTPFQCLLHSRRYVQPDFKNIKLRTLQRKKRMGYLLLVVPVSTFCLGVWQIRRRQWKLDLIKDLESRTSRPAVPLPTNYDELEDMDFCKVKVSGRFDHSREAYILPRANILGMDKIAVGSSSGAYVITPFILDNGDTILINRGWVPRERITKKSRLSGQVEGTVEFTGIVRKSEVRPSLSDRGSKSVWHARDIKGIAEALGTLPVFIDADKNSTVEGGPIGGQTKIGLRNDHLQYIVTWFCLSAATLFMWVKWFVKRV